MAGYIGSRASVVSSGAERKKTFAITTTTTVLTGLSYTPTFVHLFHNGVRLVDGTDYTATDGTSITLTSAAESGDEVVVISYATFQAADAYTKAEADSAFVSVAGDTMTGGLTVGGPFTSLGIDDNATSTAITIDASGNVGVGIATPSAQMHLASSGVSTPAAISIAGTNSGSSASCHSQIKSLESAAGSGSSEMTFHTRRVGDAFASPTEAMRISSSGSVLVGNATDPSTSVSGVRISDPANTTSRWSIGSSTVGKTAIQFLNGNGVQGSIVINSSSTSYNTSSDYRLKENITPVQGASDIVKAMRPVTYNFKADSNDWHDGFLAHELQELHPRAVTGSKDAVDEDGNPDYQGVDYSKLTPILTAALQEALNKIDALEARLTALEATP